MTSTQAPEAPDALEAVADPASERPRCVVVVGEHPMVAQSVVRALGDRGLDVVTAPWPARAPRRRRTASVERGPDVGLLLGDLDSEAGLAGARRVLARVDVSWTVLAGASRGAAWGALLAAGAATVLPASTDLATVSCLLRGEVDAATLLADDERAALLASWAVDVERRRSARTCLALLTCREREVLEQLHAGSTVHDIAATGEVSEATVRSQVKAVLRKLGVGSQVAAVSRYELWRQLAGRSGPS